MKPLQCFLSVLAFAKVSHSFGYMESILVLCGLMATLSVSMYVAISPICGVMAHIGPMVSVRLLLRLVALR